MCGITGGVWRDSRAGHERGVQESLEGLRHRGPDADGLYFAEEVALGHRRLSIIDLDPRANQPMRLGPLVITFNGEIYNYRTLRKELEQKGVTFKTESDTEVVLAAFQREGLRCLDRLEGMFAFAIWDERARMLTLARDRFGEKPLVYFENRELFAFASEPGALEVLVGGEHLEVDSVAVGLYFMLSYIPAPYGAFHHMRQLEPGTWAQFDANSWQLRSGRYYVPGQKAEAESPLLFGEAVAELRQRLTESVKLRMSASDVPVATFLSGGIDSSIIAMLAAEASNYSLHAYSVSFPEDPEFDESPYARLVAKGIPGIRHTVVEATEAKLADFTRQTISRLSEPYADSSIIPTAFLCAQVKEKVILGGDGADELFAGYGPYQAMRASARIPIWLKRIMLLVPEPAHPQSFGNPYMRAAGLFRKHMRNSLLEEYLSWRCYATCDQLSAVGIDSSGVSVLREVFSKVPIRTLRDVLIADISFNLPNDMLKKVDLASMQHSLEVRLPYLDSGLAEFALSLPEPFVLNGKCRKRILREAFKDCLPNEIRTRRKQGFLLPLRKWFRAGAIREEFRALVQRQGLLDRQVLCRFVDEHERGVCDHSVFLWACYVFFKWNDRRFGYVG